MHNGFDPSSSDVVLVLIPIRTTPGAPTIGSPTAGNASATVRWTERSSGGSPILGYRVRAYAGSTLAVTKLMAGAVESTRVTGLKNGVAYTFDVAAVNRIGIGPVWKRSAAVTPRTEFVVPTITSTVPRAGATGVRRQANITATFSEVVTGVSTGTVKIVRVSTGTPGRRPCRSTRPPRR